MKCRFFLFIIISITLSYCTPPLYQVDDRTLTIIGYLPSKYQGSVILKFSDSLLEINRMYAIPDLFKKEISYEVDTTMKTVRYYYIGGATPEVYVIDYAFEGVKFVTAFNSSLGPSGLTKENMDSTERKKLMERFKLNVLYPIEKEIDKNSNYKKFLRKN